MSILSDTEIIELGKAGYITPFVPEFIRTANNVGVLSYGVSSYGYDCRVVNEFLIYTNAYAQVIDPKQFNPDNFVKYVGDYVLIPPNSFVLTKTLEYVKVPRDCLVLVMAKSTYLRCGCQASVSILEPEWEGTITLELANTTTLPVKVYSGEGIIQLIFMKADTVCKSSYADRKGKYMHQQAITLPKV